jgi:hypothetical protein
VVDDVSQDDQDESSPEPPAYPTIPATNSSARTQPTIQPRVVKGSFSPTATCVLSAGAASDDGNQIAEPGPKIPEMLRDPAEFGVTMSFIDEALYQLSTALSHPTSGWKAELVGYLVNIWSQIAREAEWLATRPNFGTISRRHLRDFAAKARRIYTTEASLEPEIKEAIAKFQEMVWRILRAQ